MQQTVKASAAALDACAARRRASWCSSTTGSAAARASRSICRSRCSTPRWRALAGDRPGRAPRRTALERLVRTAGPDATREPVVITFDDGTADFVDHARAGPRAPRGSRRRSTSRPRSSTTGVAFPDDGRPCRGRRCRDACAHRAGRRRLAHPPPPAARPAPRRRGRRRARPVDRPRSASTSGAAPRDFAYPKALLGRPAADRAVRRRFRSAALAGTRPNPYGRDRSVPACAGRRCRRSDGMRWFEHKARGGMALRGRPAPAAEPPALLGGRHVTTWQARSRPPVVVARHDDRHEPRAAARSAARGVRGSRATRWSALSAPGPYVDALAARGIRHVPLDARDPVAWRPSRTRARCSSSSRCSGGCGPRSCTPTTRSRGCTAGSPPAWRGCPSSSTPCTGSTHCPRTAWPSGRVVYGLERGRGGVLATRSSSRTRRTCRRCAASRVPERKLTILGNGIDLDALRPGPDRPPDDVACARVELGARRRRRRRRRRGRPAGAREGLPELFEAAATAADARPERAVRRRSAPTKTTRPTASTPQDRARPQTRRRPLPR